MKKTKKDKATQSVALQTLREARGCWALLTLWLVVTLKAAGALVLNNASIGQYQNGTLPVPTDIPGLAFWWVSSDLPSSGNVSNWVDRIQSYHVTQGTGASQPTNATTGVRFDESKYLAVTNVTITKAKDAFFIIVKLDSNASAHDYWPLNDGGGGGQGNSTHMADSSGTMTWVTANGADSGPSIAITPSSLIDLIFNQTASTSVFYTNGVSGASTAHNPTTFALVDLGGTPNYNFSWTHGYIAEIGIWTNTTLTASDVANLHAYARFTYNISP